MTERAQRRLSAIVSADVVGYARLMGEDEAGTLTALRGLRAEIIDPLIAKYGGRIVKTMGDGLLLEFRSIVDAVECTIEVQSSVMELNANVPKARRIEFRVGVNLGDIVIDGEDIHGDGVNVAARLQEIAKPSGLCLSGDAYRQIRGRVEALLTDGGTVALKNIAEPVRVWHWEAAAVGIVGAARLAPTGSPPVADKPSIAVLPFDNMSGDPDQDYFADGISEDIITELSRFPDLVVIARNSSFTYKGQAAKVQDVGRDLGARYVLEGSVRRGGQRIRVTAQLIDAMAGDHIWAERYDCALTDIFEVQDEVCQAVVANVPERIETMELDHARRKRPGDMSAYDYVLRGKQHHHRSTPEDNAEALRLLDEAIKLDPDYAPAYAWKACTLAQAIGLGCGGDPDDLWARDLEAVRTGIALDPNDIECHRILCEFGMMWAKWDDAERHHNRAFELNPNDARIIAQRGELLAKLGRPEEGAEWIEKAMRLDPYGADARAHLLGRALFAAGRYADAVAAFKRLPSPRPDHLADMAACCAQLRDIDQARALAERVLQARPDFSARDYVKRRAFRTGSEGDLLFNALLAAGLPD